MTWWMPCVDYSKFIIRIQDERGSGTVNKRIKKILQKMMETYQDWYEKLPFALLAY